MYYSVCHTHNAAAASDGLLHYVPVVFFLYDKKFGEFMMIIISALLQRGVCVINFVPEIKSLSCSPARPEFTVSDQWMCVSGGILLVSPSCGQTPEKFSNSCHQSKASKHSHSHITKLMQRLQQFACKFSHKRPFDTFLASLSHIV